MITLNKIGSRDNRNVLELTAKSTDTLPTNATGGIEGQTIENGSAVILVDTCDVLIFDYETDTWNKIE